MKYYVCLLALTLALCASKVHSQTFKTLLSFTGIGGAAPGSSPYGSLTLSGTRLYGMTYAGGSSGGGNVFSVGINGSGFQNLYSFTGGTASGDRPFGSLALSGTTLYGMTENGGSNGIGNVFRAGVDGSGYQNLVSFSGTGGAAPGLLPLGSLTLGGTTLYGMTFLGGSNQLGNVFSVGFDGSGYQNLLSFTGTGGAASGKVPFGNVTLSGSTLYGMTNQGGSNGLGNVFSVGVDGSGYQNLLSFTGTDGAASGEDPYHGALVLSGTTLYGMTEYGGSNGVGIVFSVGVNGSGYQNLLSFSGTGGNASGLIPLGGLILSGTSLYGMTIYGGSNSYGNIFCVGLDGSGFQNLYSFTGGTDGGFPYGDLTLSGGTLYGMTSWGGANGDGTTFSLALPTPTPEPGTLTLAGSAAAVLVSYRWRRRRLRRRY